MSDIKVKATTVLATPPPPPPIESVIIEVDYDTARFLRELLSWVGGSIKSPSRKRAVRLSEVLDSAGIPAIYPYSEFFENNPSITVR